MNERINLDRLRAPQITDEFEGTLFGMARVYASYLGVDFDLDILPYLNDDKWWEADYGVSMVDGRAIGMSIKDAFRCLVDTHRTRQLALGIQETVSELKKHKDNLTAIDAGTGTGILAILMATYGVEHIYAIEFNHQTFQATSDFIKLLGLEDRITLIEADATTVDLDEFGISHVDILVSENLSAGFMDEPQFDIVANLSKSLAQDAQIIPYRGTIFASVGYADWESVPHEQNEIAARRLKHEELSERKVFAEIDTKVGMKVPIIEGNVSLPSRRGIVDTVFISTEFQVNQLGKPNSMKPDTSQFLGKTWAFRLPEKITASEINVGVTYRAGRRKNVIITEVIGNHVTLSDSS